MIVDLLIGGLALIAGIVLLLYANKRKKKDDHPALGMEEIDMDKFHANTTSARTQRAYAAGRGASRANYERSIAQTENIAKTLKAKKVPPAPNAKAAAQKLVKGIAFRHKVTLFIGGNEAQATEDERIILDIFKALKVNPELVNASPASQTHLGLPQVDGAADVPYLFIGGIAFGGLKPILDAAHDGSIASALTRARVAYDADAAGALRQT